MEKSKFFGQSKLPSIKPASTNKFEKTKQTENNLLTAKFGGNVMNDKNKKIAKGLGKTGIIFLVIGGIFGVLLYFFAVRPGLSLLSNINTLKSDANIIGDSLKDRDLASLKKHLEKTETDLKNLDKDKEDKFGWAKNVKLFKLNEFYSDSDRLVTAGLYGIDALRETAEIITPFADAAGLKIEEGQEVEESEGLMEAFQTWVSIMPQVADQMDPVIEKVALMGEELRPINTKKYPESIRGIPLRSNLDFAKNTLSNADQYGPDIKKALMIFPRLLGVDTPEKRYMIIMQNDKEIRPTGGFMTNYATFKINNGLLQSDFTSKDMYSIDLTLDIIDAYYDFPDPPEAYTKYLLVERWYARDMNASPDLITSMDQFLVYYNKAGTLAPYEIKPVDGIIAIDTQVVKEMLEVTGPVTVNGVTYTPDNVVLELEKIASLELKEQIGRKKVLGDLMEEMLKNVFESEKYLWSQLIDKGVDLAIRKHIQAYVFDEEAQALVEKYGIGGRIKQDVPGDYSMVVSTNLGGDKTNWFTTKQVKHGLQKEGDRWLRTVEINYLYERPAAEYQVFERRFKDWVRVYAPIGSEFIGVEGTEDGSLTDQERNKVWWSGYVEMGPGESKTLTFKYYLPDGVVSDSEYVLDIQKQAGIDREIHVVSLEGQEKSIDLFKDTQVKLPLK